MNLHIQNIGECQKCGDVFSSLFSSQLKTNLRFNLTDNPEECDLLVLVGCLTKTQLKPLKRFWKNMPREHKVLLVGNCGTEKQDLFSLKEQGMENKAIENIDITEVLPIDFNVEGCPPTLKEIIETLNNLND